MSGNWPITVVLSRELTYQASDNTETVAEGQWNLGLPVPDCKAQPKKIISSTTICQDPIFSEPPISEYLVESSYIFWWIDVSRSSTENQSGWTGSIKILGPKSIALYSKTMNMPSRSLNPSSAKSMPLLVGRLIMASLLYILISVAMTVVMTSQSELLGMSLILSISWESASCFTSVKASVLSNHLQLIKPGWRLHENQERLAKTSPCSFFKKPSNRSRRLTGLKIYYQQTNCNRLEKITILDHRIACNKMPIFWIE